jgi:large subunit ribosomal protein L35
MPKLKSNRGAAKRFKISGTGKARCFKPGKSHILTKKSPKRKRNLRKPETVDGTNMKAIRRLLPYS